MPPLLTLSQNKPHTERNKAWSHPNHERSPETLQANQTEPPSPQVNFMLFPSFSIWLFCLEIQYQLTLGALHPLTAGSARGAVPWGRACLLRQRDPPHPATAAGPSAPCYGSRTLRTLLRQQDPPHPATAVGPSASRAQARPVAAARCGHVFPSCLSASACTALMPSIPLMTVYSALKGLTFGF